MIAPAQKINFVAMPPLPGRPADPRSESARRPWVAIGLSKRTYYRRKATGLLPPPDGPPQHSAHVAAWFSTLGAMARLEHKAFMRRCLMAAAKQLEAA